MKVLTATEARAGLYCLIDDAAQSHEPVQITRKRASAILISEEDWRAIQETLYLLSVPGMRNSILKEMKVPLSSCSKKLNW